MNGATGLAQHPTSGLLFALLKLQPSGRRLVTLDPDTGTATLVGDPGDKFAAITFGADGTLYGVTGDGAKTSETLYTLDPTDATATEVVTLGNGNDGETLAFNVDDGRLYHGSGINLVNTFDGQIFESIDPSDLSIVAIPLRAELDEVTGLSFSTALGEFFATTMDSELAQLATDGSVSLRGILDHLAGGLAYDEATSTLYSIELNNATLREIDPANGSTLTSIAITLTGETINGGAGLALDPLSGALFALLKLNVGQVLATIDPATGAATGIGSPGDSFAELAFGASGTLYAVTGDGAVDPEMLYTLSTSDATPALLMTLGNGGNGEAIGFNPGDGLLYHASGEVFESIDVSTQTVTLIAALSTEEWTALTYSAPAGHFFVGDLSKNLFRLHSDASLELLGGLDHESKGLVHVPEPDAGALRLAALAVLSLLAARKRASSR